MRTAQPHGETESEKQGQNSRQGRKAVDGGKELSGKDVECGREHSLQDNSETSVLPGSPQSFLQDSQSIQAEQAKL